GSAAASIPGRPPRRCRSRLGAGCLGAGCPGAGRSSKTWRRPFSIARRLCKIWRTAGKDRVKTRRPRSDAAMVATPARGPEGPEGGPVRGGGAARRTPKAGHIGWLGVATAGSVRVYGVWSFRPRNPQDFWGQKHYGRSFPVQAHHVPKG